MKPGVTVHSRPWSIPRRWCRRWAAAIAATVLFLAACSDSDDAPGADGEACAWPVEAGKDIQNIAYPDTSARYWAFTYSLAEGESLVIKGTYPDARYFSFITYAATGGALGVLADRDIDPDEGDSNPFRGEDGDGAQRYTIVVGDPTGAEGAIPNWLTSVAVPSSPGVANPVQPEAEGLPELSLPANVVGSGGENGTIGTIIYRVYVPASDDDWSGGAGLPEVSVRSGDGTTTAVPSCATSGPSENALEIVERYGPATDTVPPPLPIFVRPGGPATNNLYPNPDNIYVATIIDHEPGRIAVLRGKAPSFPDTRAGDPITGEEQVRFWSLCTNEYTKPYPVTECARDEQVALDGDGFFTFVISIPEDRPSNAVPEEGVTWLDYGNTDLPSVLLFRQMLPAADFEEAATHLALGQLAYPAMGDYAPIGAYCATADFEANGAAGCGLGG